MLLKSLRDYWDSIVDAVHATDDLQKAMDTNDAQAAILAIEHTPSPQHIFTCDIVSMIGEYSQKNPHSKPLLTKMRNAVYNHFGERPQDSFAGADKEVKNKTPYREPHRIYALAAYMNDVEKLQELAEYGITPDSVSNHHSVTENIVMGTARLGMLDTLKEVIRQGASLERNYGYDEFPPMHAFTKPLFHIMHPGVTEALLETRNEKIINAVKRAQAAMHPAPVPA